MITGKEVGAKPQVMAAGMMAIKVRTAIAIMVTVIVMRITITTGRPADTTPMTPMRTTIIDTLMFQIKTITIKSCTAIMNMSIDISLKGRRGTSPPIRRISTITTTLMIITIGDI